MQYIQGKMKEYYKNQNLSKKIFDNKKLKRISFIKKNLKKASFENCKLEECDFWESNLSYTSFNNVKFKNCILTDTDLSTTSFRNSIFIDSNLSHANLKEVNFKTTKFINVNLRDSIFNDKTRWPDNFNPLSCGATKEKKEKKKLLNKKKTTKTKKIVNNIIYALTKGKGYYIVKNYFNKKKIKKALSIVKNEIKINKNVKGKRLKFSRDKKLNQEYVYNLVNLNKIFIELIQPKLTMEVCKKVLGEKFICGYFGANCLMPGARGQIPHIDYPYLNMIKPGEKVPFNIGKIFLFNCQTLIPLNDMHEKNGATTVLKNSHKLRKFPNRDEIKKKKFKQIKLSAGSMLISNGLMWHAAMPNYTYNQYRVCIVGQYLPYFITPMLDLKKTTKKEIIKKDKKLLRQLLGIDLKFPETRY